MEQYLDGTWKFRASKLVKHQDGTYYFHLCCEKDVKTREVTNSSTFMGVDVGQNFLAVASTTAKKCRFFCGGKAKDLRNIYSIMRKRLQSKGTRSAKRMLKHLSGRERRLMTDMNHRVSKEIVGFAVQNNVDVIGLEDLSGIRDRTETSKKQRYTHHSWAFFELQSFIEYKAREKGISTVFIDPAYTSQTCPSVQPHQQEQSEWKVVCLRMLRTFDPCRPYRCSEHRVQSTHLQVYLGGAGVQSATQTRTIDTIESQAPPSGRGG